MTRFDRSAMLIGGEGLARLSRAHVAVFGLGGVGSWAAEALARSGIGALTLIDHDAVDVTNLNRQLVALESTLGKKKAEVMKARIADINPGARVHARIIFYTAETKSEIDLKPFDYIIDAIDTVTSKLELILSAQALNIPVISSMGTGNKLHPEKLMIADLYQTRVCPLARAMRNQAKKRGIRALEVVYSTEIPKTREAAPGRTPGSMPFVPPAAGLMMAAHVTRRLLGITD